MGGAPRTILELTLLDDGDIIKPGMKFLSCDAAELAVCELYEKKGKLSVVSGRAGLEKGPARLAVGCSCGGANCGRFNINFSIAAKVWTCSRATRFECSNLAVPSQRFGTTAYTPQMLAPLLLRLMVEGDDVTAREVRATVSNTAGRNLSATYIKSTRMAARQQFDGDPVEALAMMPALAAALIEQNWKVEIFTRNADEMRLELLRIAEAKHAEWNASREAPLRTRFDPTVVPTLPTDAKYLFGFAISPPSAEQLHERSQHFASSDFAHCTEVKGLGGVLGSRYASDSNKALADIAHVRLLANEDEAAWTMLNKATLRAVPSFDRADQVDASDGDKGGKASKKKIFLLVKSFLDFKHRAEALAKSGGKATADAYREAFHAKWRRRHRRDKAGLVPAGVRRRIGAEEDAVQFPAACVAAGGSLRVPTIQAHKKLSTHHTDPIEPEYPPHRAKNLSTPKLALN